MDAWNAKRPFTRVQVRASAIINSIHGSIINQKVPDPIKGFLK